MNRDFRQGVIDILPILAAACPVALLWGTVAAGKGLSPLEAGLMSFAVFAGASQIIAIELWKEPAPWALLAATAFIVNIRHVLMSASVARHMGPIPAHLRAPILWFLADENWAFCERRALTGPLTLGYYLGLAIPMVTLWTAFSVAGAILGLQLGRPAAIGFDFAFSAMFIGILAGFVKTPQTGAVLAASAVAAALAKLYVPGAWFIIIGGLAGVAVAALLWKPDAP